MSTREAVPALVAWNDIPNVHLAVINAARNRVGIALRVFKALSTVVIVSVQWAWYCRSSGRDQVGNFIKLDPKSRTVTRSSLAEAIIEFVQAIGTDLEAPGPGERVTGGSALPQLLPKQGRHAAAIAGERGGRKRPMHNWHRLPPFLNHLRLRSPPVSNRAPLLSCRVKSLHAQ